MTRIVTSHYRYKRPPSGRKPVAVRKSGRKKGPGVTSRPKGDRFEPYGS
jgi:hypothetical protein